MGRLLEGMGPSTCHPPQVIYPPIIPSTLRTREKTV